MKSKITLDKDRKKQMISSIQEFFQNERDETLGEIAASMILDFIIDNIGSEFYNQGVYDSYRFISEKSEDLLGLQK